MKRWPPNSKGSLEAVPLMLLQELEQAEGPLSATTLANRIFLGYDTVNQALARLERGGKVRFVMGAEWIAEKHYPDYVRRSMLSWMMWNGFTLDEVQVALRFAKTALKRGT